ncbi:MAG: FAD-dependent oxidoreductase, partial [Pseudomonadota bacterium]
MTADVTILGAGVAGLTLATELGARGAEVQLIDPVGRPGEHACSWWAGGMLAPDCEGALTEPQVVHHGRAAAAWWEGKGAEVVRQGTLVIALGRDRSELATFKRRVPAAQAVDAAAIAALEPDLGERFRHGLFLPDEAHLDPRAALQHLHDRLSARQVVPQPAADLEGTVIDCRGLSAQVELGDLRGVKGEMVVVRSPDISLSRPVRLLH